MKKNVFFFVSVVVSTLTFAASFDCQKAASTNEKAICQNPQLSSLDEDLAKVYKSGLASTNDPDGYKQNQKAWLKEIKGCETSSDAIGCLTTAYNARIANLKQATTSQSPTNQQTTTPSQTQVSAPPAPAVEQATEAKQEAASAAPQQETDNDKNAVVSKEPEKKDTETKSSQLRELSDFQSNLVLIISLIITLLVVLLPWFLKRSSKIK